MLCLVHNSAECVYSHAVVATVATMATVKPTDADVQESAFPQCGDEDENAMPRP